MGSFDLTKKSCARKAAVALRAQKNKDEGIKNDRKSDDEANGEKGGNCFLYGNDALAYVAIYHFLRNRKRKQLFIGF